MYLLNILICYIDLTNLEKYVILDCKGCGNMKDFAKKIQDIGGIAYFVGGCIRDELMNKKPHDIDVVVTGITTSDFMNVFPKAEQTGKSFPVYRIYVKGKEIEVAFARIEEKINEGHNGFHMIFSPDITIEDDLFRRDITINAIAKNILTGEIIDPYNGRKDIENHNIRATSCHFSEDALRVLRVARFAAQFNFGVDVGTLQLMKDCKEELKKEPKERIISEMKKALATDNPRIFFETLRECDCLDVVFPEIYNLIGKTQPIQYHPEGDAYNHSMIVLSKVSKQTSNIVVRFAALYHDIGKCLTPVENLPHNYGHDFAGAKLIQSLDAQYENRMKEVASFVAKNHMRVHTMKKESKIIDVLVEMKRKNISIDMFAPILMADHDSIPIWLNKKLFDYVFQKIDLPQDMKNVNKIKNYILNLRIRRFKEAMKQIEV